MSLAAILGLFCFSRSVYFVVVEHPKLVSPVLGHIRSQIPPSTSSLPNVSKILAAVINSSNEGRTNFQLTYDDRKPLEITFGRAEVAARRMDWQACVRAIQVRILPA